MNDINNLANLRKPFPENQISKLPKPTKAQTDEVKRNFKAGIRCELCGGWHHPKVVHLDYVGHAALTDRLLETDPGWNWEPMSLAENGQPLYDTIGGLWIKLTVCGVTRLGYGNADGKQGGNAIKEVIGDALRNAAMRFGAGLDLWHKGELHSDEIETESANIEKPKKVTKSSLTKVETTAVDQLFQLSESNDALGLRQTWDELNQTEKNNVWEKLPQDTKTHINSLLKAA